MDGDNIRILTDVNVNMYDGEGNIVLCKCGNPATSGMMGKNAYVSFCEDCSPMSKYSFKMIYKPPIP